MVSFKYSFESLKSGDQSPSRGDKSSFHLQLEKFLSTHSKTWKKNSPAATDENLLQEIGMILPILASLIVIEEIKQKRKAQQLKLSRGVNRIEMNKKLAWQLRPEVKVEKYKHNRVSISMPFDSHLYPKAKSENVTKQVLEKKETILAEKVNTKIFELMANDIKKNNYHMQVQQDLARQQRHYRQCTFLHHIALNNFCIGLRTHLQVTLSSDYLSLRVRTTKPTSKLNSRSCSVSLS